MSSVVAICHVPCKWREDVVQNFEQNGYTYRDSIHVAEWLEQLREDLIQV